MDDPQLSPTGQQAAAAALTRAIVLAGILAAAAYDAAMWLRYGGAATISTSVGALAAAHWTGWLACAVLGGLAGHFLGMMPSDTPDLTWRLFAFAAALLVAYELTA